MCVDFVGVLMHVILCLEFVSCCFARKYKITKKKKKKILNSAVCEHYEFGCMGLIFQIMFIFIDLNALFSSLGENGLSD